MKLVFIYNADSGLLNAILDSVRKIVSPSSYPCSLCAITYGLIRMDPEWKRYVEGLRLETIFLHRDELSAAYPKIDAQLPAILLDRDGMITTLVAATELDQIKSVNELVGSLNSALARETGL